MRKPLSVAAVALATLMSVAAQASPQLVHEARYVEDGAGHRRLALMAPVAGRIQSGNFRAARDLDGVVENSFPRAVVEHKPFSDERVVVLRAKDQATLARALRARGVDTSDVDNDRQARFDEEVVTLVDSGPSENRIDLVFMGDGYTAAEREKFFADIQRIVADMFEGPTYRSYLPLFNVHAVFKASNESGIGRNDRPKDTAYSLYREGETLRAIFPGDPASARRSCRMAPGCDYPVIIANDPYYGGLGGEFAIATSSETSGTIVLRHELGHNFGQVGEEYDGGGYFGKNNSASLNVSWAHWLTAGGSRATAEPAVARHLAWPWHLLSRGPFRVPFTSDGRQASAAIRISASHIATDDDWRVTLDGQSLGLHSPGHNDRTFYNVAFDRGFTAGNHELKFEQTGVDDENWVSSLTIHEFGEGYHSDPEYIGAYPVFDQQNRVAGYRPNHETCLMRNMESRRFCAVCVENNWLHFLDRVSLIDDVVKETTDGRTHVRVATQGLGNMLKITWLRNNQPVAELADQTEWTLPAADARGQWKVQVRFETPEIRRDTAGATRDEESFTL